MDEALEAAKEGYWRDLAAIDAAYARGELDDAGWHAAAAAARPAGKYARSLLVDAVRPGQSFLDAGCANGHLMESMAAWADVEPYGLETAPELAALARRRLPHWADRIWVGNAIDWPPPRRFDLIRTGLDYVPAPRRRELVERLLGFCSRLVVGVHNEERDAPGFPEDVAGWGLAVAGRSERPHPHPRLVYRAFWIDRA